MKMINYYCEDRTREVWDLGGAGTLLFPFQLCSLRCLRGFDRVSSPLSNYQLLFLPLTQLSCLYWLYVYEVAGTASSVGEGDCAAYCLC